MDSFREMKHENALQFLLETCSVEQLREFLNDPQSLDKRAQAVQARLVGDRHRRITSWFSRLGHASYQVTSNIDFAYNCIAWAAGDVERFWWPVGQAYWPDNVPREESLDALIRLFENRGFWRCEDGQVEAGMDKVALYASQGFPTHASRQLPNGRWTSKLGRWEDIEHGEFDLAGTGPDEYGEIVQYLRRPRS